MDKEEYIICAAIHFDDNKEHFHLPRNLKTGLVIGGWRHHNCFTTMFELNPNYRKEGFKITQGFLTSKGNFVNRKEARKIAYDAKQVDDFAYGWPDFKTKDLFSEDLY